MAKVILKVKKTAYGIDYAPGEEITVRDEIADKMIKAGEAEFPSESGSEEAQPVVEEKPSTNSADASETPEEDSESGSED